MEKVRGRGEGGLNGPSGQGKKNLSHQLDTQINFWRSPGPKKGTKKKRGVKKLRRVTVDAHGRKRVRAKWNRKILTAKGRGFREKGAQWEGREEGSFV